MDFNVKCNASSGVVRRCTVPGKFDEVAVVVVMVVV
jgi:hypothetical protein